MQKLLILFVFLTATNVAQGQKLPPTETMLSTLKVNSFVCVAESKLLFVVHSKDNGSVFIRTSDRAGMFVDASDTVYAYEDLKVLPYAEAKLSHPWESLVNMAYRCKTGGKGYSRVVPQDIADGPFASILEYLKR